MGTLNREMKALLLGILKAHETAGETELASTKLGQFLTACFGSVCEGKARLGELQTIRDACHKIQNGSFGYDAIGHCSSIHQSTTCHDGSSQRQEH